MIKSAAYIEFETGFLKQAEAEGMDIPFLKGLIAHAEEMQDKWAEYFDYLETQQPGFKVKLASELWDIALANGKVKLALEGGGDQDVKYQLTPEYQANQSSETPGYQQGWFNNPTVLKFLKSIGGGNGGWGGAGVGGLGGLLLGMLTGNPMMGVMMGGLGGLAGYGYGSGWLNKQFGQENPSPETPGSSNADQSLGPDKSLATPATPPAAPPAAPTQSTKAPQGNTTPPPAGSAPQGNTTPPPAGSAPQGSAAPPPAGQSGGLLPEAGNIGVPGGVGGIGAGLLGSAAMAGFKAGLPGAKSTATPPAPPTQGPLPGLTKSVIEGQRAKAESGAMTPPTPPAVKPPTPALTPSAVKKAYGVLPSNMSIPSLYDRH